MRNETHFIHLYMIHKRERERGREEGRAESYFIDIRCERRDVKDALCRFSR